MFTQKIHLTQLNKEKIDNQKTKNNEEIQSLEINNKRLDSDISVIILKIPRLEEEKQKFVISKNFKEAGRISSELKLQREEKDKLSSKIIENKNKISMLRDVNQNFDKELLSTMEEKIKEEENLNLIKYQYLLCYRKYIDELVTKFRQGKFYEDLRLFEEELGLIDKDISLLYEKDNIRTKFPKALKRSEENETVHDDKNEAKIKLEESYNKSEEDNKAIDQNEVNSLIN